MENARNSVNTIKRKFKPENIQSSFNVEKSASTYEKFMQNTPPKPYGSNGVSPENSPYYESMNNYSSTPQEKIISFWRQLNARYNNKNEYNNVDIRTLKEILYSQKMKYRKVYRNVTSVCDIYENRMGDIRDIFTKSIFINPSIYNPNKDETLQMFNGNYDPQMKCKDCGGFKEDYLKRLGKGSNLPSNFQSPEKNKRSYTD